MALPIARMAVTKQCANAFRSNAPTTNSGALMALVLTKRPNAMEPKIVMIIQVIQHRLNVLSCFLFQHLFDYFVIKHFIVVLLVQMNLPKSACQTTMRKDVDDAQLMSSNADRANASQSIICVMEQKVRFQ